MATEKTEETLKLYRSWFEALNFLETDDEKGHYLLSLARFYFEGIEPEDKTEKLLLQPLRTELSIMKEKRGKYSPNWKGGITLENTKQRASLIYKLWIRAVFERDDFNCQKCGKHGGKLNAHHIKGFAKYPGLRFEVANGITLCEKCHRKYHKENGR